MSTAAETPTTAIEPVSVRERLLAWKEILEPPTHRSRGRSTRSASGWSSPARPSSR